jgi:hypothetical protein
MGDTEEPIADINRYNLISKATLYSVDGSGKMVKKRRINLIKRIIRIHGRNFGQLWSGWGECYSIDKCEKGEEHREHDIILRCLKLERVR